MGDGGTKNSFTLSSTSVRVGEIQSPPLSKPTRIHLESSCQLHLTNPMYHKSALSSNRINTKLFPPKKLELLNKEISDHIQINNTVLLNNLDMATAWETQILKIKLAQKLLACLHFSYQIEAALISHLTQAIKAT